MKPRKYWRAFYQLLLLLQRLEIKLRIRRFKQWEDLLMASLFVFGLCQYIINLEILNKHVVMLYENVIQ